ncbi:phytanoyl-CoA dioxygenase family protein [Ancylobacter aquaticus]|uniref:Phytanoyl-CoA dioxygenase n=3 Tax=Xanthobacteraceae TaxID=335928 RepID=A0A168S647_XANAU|nr:MULTISPECIES: phytanoyl-CoA dioxygenase family protein [Xanthobacteraceae]ANC67840.1 phytanoyl-CoA dioxygenase [Ancylobacter novellus]ANC67905.1 phytanoyl-CoA dioxygenase [Xanthobacter autotrophicus]ANC67930.1 phytanoyl-CoA dioxygenase [Xanthobacter flavus]RTL87449.1 phytanoyl-CoA dioxygenase family protein [Ancylobacter aquaticus]
MSDNFDTQAYNTADHAKTHRRLQPGPERNTPEIERDFETVMRDGYVIIENLIPREACKAIKEEGLALLDQTGRNPFEGHSTQRVYNVLGKTRVTDQLAVHPHILGLMDRLFEPGCLLSQSQIINILPGEAPQGLHHDDVFYRLPRPRQPLGAATVWAIDDFTEQNGATVIVPGSHRWGADRRPTQEEAIPAVMPAGSVIFFLGTTWHGGGKNGSDEARFAITHQYCEAYVRQQENYLLELSKDTVRRLSPEPQALVGYSIYPPFMGMVEGMHPLRTLDAG